MTDNEPGGNSFRAAPSSRRVKPAIIAFAAAFIIFAGISFAIKMSNTAKPADSLADGDFLQSFIPAFRDSCLKSANAALTQRGVDLSANGMGAKVEAYCGCATDHASSELTVPELEAFKRDATSEPAASKIKNIVQECQQKMAQ